MKTRKEPKWGKYEGAYDDPKPQHTNEVSHTPTPWKIEWNIDPINAGEHSTGEVQIWADVSEADAAFIVRAVNAHQEMKLTLESVLANIQENKEAFGGSRYSIISMIKKAIAKAEGR